MITTILQMPSHILLAFIVFVIVMISVPPIKWIFGTRAEALAIAAGVGAQIITVLLILLHYLPQIRALVIILGIPFAGWLAEFIGHKTGMIFGPYYYTNKLQPQLGGVPLLIPLAWLMMLVPSWAIGQVTARFFNLDASTFLLLSAGISALAMTAWDLYLDPQMVRWDFWQWKKKGIYFGIPSHNFIGWFFVSLVVSFLLAPILPIPSLVPLLLIYTITCTLEFIAQTFFWNMKGPAIWGFASMGLLSALAWVTYGNFDIFKVLSKG